MNENDLKQFSQDFLNLEREIGSAIIGQQEVVRYCLIAIIAGGNVLLEGLPGLGKTQLVKTLGKVLELSFSRIQFTPDLMPSDVTGTDIMLKGEDGNAGFSFREGPVFSNIVLADEINRATPKTQSALLEAMQEKTVTVGTSTYSLPKPFFVLATQNPIELEGTYPLPEAQLDRFLFKLNVKFPSAEELLKIVNLTTSAEIKEPDAVLNGQKLIEMGILAKSVPIAEPVAQYVMNLIVSTHPENEASPEVTKKYVQYGASPRAAQAIVNASRILALINSRFNVSFEDIKSVALPALRHRILPNFEAIADGMDSDRIIAEILEAVQWK